MGGGGPGGGGGKDFVDSYEPGVKLDVDDDGLAPYFDVRLMSSGAVLRKLFIGGLLVRRPLERDDGLKL